MRSSGKITGLAAALLSLMVYGAGAAEVSRVVHEMDVIGGSSDESDPYPAPASQQSQQSMQSSQHHNVTIKQSMTSASPAYSVLQHEVWLNRS